MNTPANLPAASAPSNATDPVPGEDDPFALTAPDYDPAEYRWVPVRRRPRYDGWTEEKQRRFIEVLADTGLVGLAAKEVGMNRASAYRLRRAAHAGAFARAWDRARELAGALIEDIAFERAIEGVEVEVYTRDGEVAGTRTVYNDRLLTFLLRHLKPETSTAAARERRGSAWLGGNGAAGARGGQGAPDDAALLDHSLDGALRAMEPPLPAPPEELLGPDQLADELLTADVADGVLPQFLSEQRREKSPERLLAEERAARHERGLLADGKMARGEPLDDAEFEDLCAYLDPAEAAAKRRKPRPARKRDRG